MSLVTNQPPKYQHTYTHRYLIPMMMLTPLILELHDLDELGIDALPLSPRKVVRTSRHNLERPQQVVRLQDRPGAVRVHVDRVDLVQFALPLC